MTENLRFRDRTLAKQVYLVSDSMRSEDCLLSV